MKKNLCEQIVEEETGLETVQGEQLVKANELFEAVSRAGASSAGMRLLM
jgi:hypothetical protein